jgi:DNA-binding transcriptional MocR family regulator
LFQEAWREVFAGPSIAREALQYSTTEGYLPLRQWIDILVTSGSQQALDLTGKLLLDPGSGVITARPTYLGALQSFSAYEPQFSSLEAPQPTGPTAPRLIYLVPDFANPDGATMSRSARHQALDQARALDAVILEDAAYSALRYDGEDLPPIAALDAQSRGIEATRTLYCGTFSKTLSPGLRVGWVCGPTALIRKLTLLKQGADLHTATTNQMVMHRVAVEGYDAQVARARSVYRVRRDAMLAALERYAPPNLHWKKPDGGMFLWLELPDHLDAKALLQHALQQDIAFVPGAAFHTDGSGHNTMRLSFSLSDEAQIEVGIFKLCGLIGQQGMARAVSVS